MSTGLLRFFLFVSALFADGSAAASPLVGNPPVTRLIPSVEVYPQNFDVAQGPDATVYLANAEGVLVFDGERWTHVPLPNGDLVRSITADAGGRIYVGGYNQFGYLERDATGAYEFHDLTAAFSVLLGDEKFADIWDVEAGPEGVFFRAVKHLFHFNPQKNEVHLWRHEGRFGDILRVDGEFIMQFRGEGLRRFVNGEWLPIAGTEALSELIYEFVPLPDGGFAGLAVNGKWMAFANGAVKPFTVPEGFPASSQFSEGLLMRDGTLAFTSQDGWLYVLDTRAKRFRRFNLEAGFISGFVPALDGGLLMTDDEALMHVAWPAEWTMLGKEQGLVRPVSGLSRFNGSWYVLSGSGVQEIRQGKGGSLDFRNHDWTAHEAWDLLDIGDGTALLAESYAVMQVKDGSSVPVTGPAVYPRMLVRSRFDPDVVFAGTELGLTVLQRTGPDWKVILQAEDFGDPAVSSIEQVSSTELWLGSERGGLMHVFLASDYSSIEGIEVLTAEDGIEYGPLNNVEVARHPEGWLLASTERGFFRLENSGAVPESLGGLAELKNETDKEEMLRLRFAPNGDVWAHSYKHVFHQLAGGEWRKLDIHSQLRGAIEDIRFDESGGAVLVATGGLLRHEHIADAVEHEGAGVRLTTVARIGADGELQRLPLLTSTPIAFKSGEDVHIAFRFALPDFSEQKSVRYSARMVGIEEQWSDWSPGSGFAYYRMRPGDYSLELRGRDSAGRITEIQPWKFSVAPPWYASRSMQTAWVILGLLVLGSAVHFVTRRRTSRLANEKQRLEAMVVERTRELEAANRRLEMMAHLDGLTEIPNRRKLDEYLEQVWAHCHERRRPLSLLVIDVDRFKAFNDEHGHIAGDILLKKLARTLSNTLRRSEDLVARYGGEEFLVVLPGADLEAAQELAEAMRERTETSSLGATISVGIASATPDNGLAVTDLVNRADTALYEAKAAGRNCIRTAMDDGSIR